jgi:Ca-activated chloride channel homolog
MIFERAWVLLFLILPLIWAYFEWRRTRRTAALVLKTLSILAIILALAEPTLTVPETKMAVAVLVDTSASVMPQDLARASKFATALDKARGRHWIRVLPFARSVRDLTPGEDHGLHLQPAAGETGRATDLEASIDEAISSLPSGLVPRLVLISDGQENAGSITRAAWQAQRLGIPIDTVSMQGRPQPTLRLQSVTVPTTAFTGEQFPVDLNIISPSSVTGSVQISAEGKVLGSHPVKLEQGDNQVRVHASLATAGALNLAGVIQTNGLGEIRFDRALTLRRPKILYISQDPPGTEKNLLQTLAAAQFDIDRTADAIHGSLADYQIVILNNLDLESLPAARKDEFEKFVQQGGGLLVIAGERNMYAQTKKVEDALDRTLPAKLAPPRSPEGTAVVLIIDKSSSMEGKKIELARQAAVGVVEHLRPIDLVGVLIFDNSFQWDVPIRHAEDKVLIKRLISGIIPDGGTQIAPALQAHCAAYGWYLGRGRQPRPVQGGSGPARYHLDCRVGPGCKPRVSRKGRLHRRRQIIFLE